MKVQPSWKYNIKGRLVKHYERKDWEYGNCINFKENKLSTSKTRGHHSKIFTSWINEEKLIHIVLLRWFFKVHLEYGLTWNSSSGLMVCIPNPPTYRHSKRIVASQANKTKENKTKPRKTRQMKSKHNSLINEKVVINFIWLFCQNISGK